MPGARAARERAFFDILGLDSHDGSGAGAARGHPRSLGFRAIYAAIRREILSGTLKSGTRLPSTRALAATCGVARMTVVTAYDQLRAEGYIESRVGSGTRVTDDLPGRGHRTRRAADGSPLQRPALAPMLAPRATEYAAFVGDGASEISLGGSAVRAFRPGVPALDAFPIRQWAALASRYYRRAGRLLLADGDPRGYRPLREAIAGYLGASRGVRCDADQVIVVAGSQQGIHLAARVCLAPGDAAWIEEPGYPNARRALRDAGARVVPVPVDDEGLDVAAGRARAPDARLAFVTPAHQAPLGVVLSVRRRLALLTWAERTGAWILEDDYDSEYRYAGHPLPALHGLDRDAAGAAADHVLYLGTFSKTLFPALRLGYLVVPPALVDAVAGARAMLDRHSPVVEQAIVAEFLERGWFARHVRRMRALYAERQRALLSAVERELPDTLRVAPSPGGLHLLGWLPPGVCANAACRAARSVGVESLSLSGYYSEHGAETPQALMLGHAAVDAEAMRAPARRLARALRPLLPASQGAASR